jgi:hypothetical protein
MTAAELLSVLMEQYLDDDGKTLPSSHSIEVRADGLPFWCDVLRVEADHVGLVIILREEGT